MAQVCAICRRAGPDLDVREVLPRMDPREYRLLDRAIHSECFQTWRLRRQFAAEFHEAARESRRQDLSLGADGRIYEGPAPDLAIPQFREGLMERLGLLSFRGGGLLLRLRHYERVGLLVGVMLVAILLALVGFYLVLTRWPLGLLVGGMLVVVAALMIGHIWRWSPILLRNREDRP